MRTLFTLQSPFLCQCIIYVYIFTPFIVLCIIRTHHTQAHLHPLDSLAHHCKLVTCSHKCGCHMRTLLDKEVSELNLVDRQN